MSVESPEDPFHQMWSIELRQTHHSDTSVLVGSRHLVTISRCPQPCREPREDDKLETPRSVERPKSHAEFRPERLQLGAELTPAKSTSIQGAPAQQQTSHANLERCADRVQYSICESSIVRGPASLQPALTMHPGPPTYLNTYSDVSPPNWQTCELVSCCCC